MSTKWRHLEVMLPRQFDDRRTVMKGESGEDGEDPVAENRP
jgi:hypothetical protein